MAKLLGQGGRFGNIELGDGPAQPSSGGARRPIPETGRLSRVSGRQIYQERGREERQFWEPLARRLGGDELAVGADQLFGREWDLLDGPARRIEGAGVPAGQDQVGHQDPRLFIDRVVHDQTLKDFGRRSGGDTTAASSGASCWATWRSTAVTTSASLALALGARTICRTTGTV